MARRPPSLPPEDAPPPEPADPTPVQHRLGAHRAFTPLDGDSGADGPDPNSALAVRKINRDEEDSRGDRLLDPIARTARRRHWRDYVLVMLLGNGFFGMCAWLLPGAIVFAGAGMIVLSLGVTWTYVFVLDPH